MGKRKERNSCRRSPDGGVPGLAIIWGRGKRITLTFLVDQWGGRKGVRLVEKKKGRCIIVFARWGKWAAVSGWVENLDTGTATVTLKKRGGKGRGEMSPLRG